MSHVGGTKKNRWELFREEVIELDGGRCVRCGKDRQMGAILQVHHKQYIKGRKPWEYSYSDCETLCKGCHAGEHGLIPPKTGWEYLGEEDLGGLEGTCEYCGTDIRYVFYISHPKWPSLGVGTVCCDNLTETQLASNHMESVRRFATRKERFVVSPRWKRSNGRVDIQQKGLVIGIDVAGSTYRIWVNGQPGKKRFKTIDQAKEQVFEVIENGKAEAYLRKKGVTRQSGSV